MLFRSLIEIPVGARLSTKALLAPVFAVQRIPDFFQCKVILDVFGGAGQFNGDNGVVSECIVFYGELFALRLAFPVSLPDFRF